MRPSVTCPQPAGRPRSDPRAGAGPSLRRGCAAVRPPGGLVAARFRHYEARSGMPLLHDHLMLSVKGQRLNGKWGSVHSEVLFENTVAASALYNEIVMAEVCEVLGLASEPRTVTAGRRSVMEIAGVPHELIRWTSRRSDQLAACRAELEHEYVTAVDDDGNLKFAPEVSEQARAKLNRIAAKMTRPPKQQARPLAQLRAWWKTSAILTSGVAGDVINSLLERARVAAAAIRARVAAVVDVALAAVDVTAMVFVMNKDGFFHRRHLLAEARRHLALVLRGRRREPGLDERIVDAAIATHCLDISEPKTLRGHMPAYRFYTARWPLADPPPAAADRRPTPRPTTGPRPGRAIRTRPVCPWSRGSGTSRASRCSTSARSSLPPFSAPGWVPRAAPAAPCTTTWWCTSRPRCRSSCSSSPRSSHPRRPARRSTSRPCAPTWRPWS
ncbi:MobF family relaxase [Streptomyces cellulosae]|uniref:MobF family relaxase n=1 Tax=Streptomyces cellulosae TaxID=1968 RepID=A0ABW7YHP9_STRCE